MVEVVHPCWDHVCMGTLCSSAVLPSIVATIQVIAMIFILDLVHELLCAVAYHNL
jgi:hypothetical protein